MDRETQLSNVAFGGAWSEEIAGQEALQQARQVLEEAVEQCAMVDLRQNTEVLSAIQLLAMQHPKGILLVRAWERAYGIGETVARNEELRRVAGELMKRIPYKNARSSV